MTIYFISGHLDLAPKEFREHYKPLIDEALLELESTFVVGDARGADTLAQQYLMFRLRGCSRSSVTVYHMFGRPRYHVDPKAITLGGFKSDKERDEAMTVDSDKDIAWVRPGRETSGTAQNLKRRQA